MRAQLLGSPVREELFSTDPPALLVGACSDCRSLHFPRRALCPECQSERIETRATSGAGRIYAHTIVRSAPPGYLGEIPYAIGVVELEESLRVSTTLLADDLSELAVGDQVEFELITLGHDAPIISYAYRQVLP